MKAKNIFSLNNAVEKITGLNSDIIIIILGGLLYYFNYLSEKKFSLNLYFYVLQHKKMKMELLI